jgi:hypothetical protein
MKGGQSSEVGSRESQREGVNERREGSARAGWKGGGFGGAEIFANKVKVTKSDG